MLRTTRNPKYLLLQSGFAMQQQPILGNHPHPRFIRSCSITRISGYFLQTPQTIEKEIEYPILCSLRNVHLSHHYSIYSRVKPLPFE